MTFYVGQRVNESTQVKNQAGVLTDATVVLTVTKPDGTTATPTVNHPGTGLYDADVTLDQAGDWLYVWTSTGVVVTAEPGQWHVVAPALRIVGLAEVKRHGNIESSANDRELLDFIGTAQQMIEKEVGATVPRTVVDERQPAAARVWLDHAPVLSVTSVVPVAGATTYPALLASAYTLHGPSGALTRAGYGYWVGSELLVTDVACRKPIDEGIRWAAKELTIHLWRATQAQRAGGRARGGADAGESVAALGYALPNRVVDALAPFKKPPAVY